MDKTAVLASLLMLGLLVACHEPSTPTSVAQVTASSEAKRAQLSGELFYPRHRKAPSFRSGI